MQVAWGETKRVVAEAERAAHCACAAREAGEELRASLVVAEEAVGYCLVLAAVAVLVLDWQASLALAVEEAGLGGPHWTRRAICQAEREPGSQTCRHLRLGAGLGRRALVGLAAAAKAVEAGCGRRQARPSWSVALAEGLAGARASTCRQCSGD